MSLKFAVYGKTEEEYEDKITALKDHHTAEEVYYEEEMAETFGLEGEPLEDILKKDIDFIMSIGGDGTLLRLMQFTELPALGVNTGTVGFLTNVELPEIDDALERIDEGDYFIDERFKLDVHLNGKKLGGCTNEMVLFSDEIARLRKMKVYHGSNMIDRFRADGMIVATPTGSTCYAMSAGGPIVNPKLEVFIVVPITPFDMATKPHVVPVDNALKVELTEKEKSGLVVLDGKKEYKVSNEDEIKVVPGEKKAKLISFEDNFYDKIKQKLVSKSVFG